MRYIRFSRLAASLVVLGVTLFVGTGCSDAAITPTGAPVRSAAAFSSRIPSPHAAAIRQRVADKRSHGLDAVETARVASLKGKWQWVADLHHEAMQSAIHDVSLHGLRQQHSAEERCATGRSYLKKYFARIESHSGRHYNSDAERSATIDQIAAKTGVCQQPAQASIFFTAAPSFTRLSRGRRSASPELIGTPVGVISVDEVVGAWRDYTTAMATDLRHAKDLGDATEIMDTYVAAAAADADVSPASLALIAGTVDLASSSAEEWDAFGRAREGSIFLWGWLSDIGDWVSTVFSGDLNGCMDGVEAGIVTMLDTGFGSWSSFLGVSASFCAGGGIVGSIAAAM